MKSEKEGSTNWLSNMFICLHLGNRHKKKRYPKPARVHVPSACNVGGPSHPASGGYLALGGVAHPKLSPAGGFLLVF
jgi:hypothetical protein